MNVRVEQVSVTGTVATCVGREQDSGERVAFHVEHRAAAAITDAVSEASEVDALPVAEVAAWHLAGS